MSQAAVAKMRHRATVQRNSASGRDDWNDLPEPVWAAHLTAKCFYWATRKREQIDEDKSVVLEEGRCLMPLATDITEQDRINTITDRSGAVIYSGTLYIDAVMRHQTHLELILERRNA